MLSFISSRKEMLRVIQKKQEFKLLQRLRQLQPTNLPFDYYDTATVDKLRALSKETT